MKILLLILTFLFFLNPLKATNYYIDYHNGNDQNRGLSVENAWKTFTKINNTIFQPGDSILFRRGGIWKGTIHPGGSGTKSNPIVFDAYGKGEAPIFNAEGKINIKEYISATILLVNQEYWEFRNIEVRNFEAGDPDVPAKKVGILVIAKDVGTLHHFTFENLKICEINGSLKTRENGGIFLNVITDEDPNKRVPTRFDGIYVNNCRFLNVDRGGFLNQSYWRKRDLNTRFGETYCDTLINNWFPSENILIENCRFENIGGNGLVTRVAQAPVVQNNLFIKCSLKTTGNASYPYNCDNALWQYNEACYTVYNEGDVDASGFDSDYLCKNTTIQFNFSHHNDWGGLLICSWGKHKGSFNHGTVIKNNVFIHEKHHMIRYSGNITNSKISENLFVIDSQINDVMLWFKEWGGLWPENSSFTKNIIYNSGTEKFIRLGEARDYIFKNNTLAGNSFNDFNQFKAPEDYGELKNKVWRISNLAKRKNIRFSTAEEVINTMWLNDKISDH